MLPPPSLLLLSPFSLFLSTFPSFSPSSLLPLPFLLSSPPNHIRRAQLASTITSICNADFPEKWDSLIPKITTLVHSQNPAYMHGALLALLMAFRKYSYVRKRKKRGGGEKKRQGLIEL